MTTEYDVLTWLRRRYGARGGNGYRRRSTSRAQQLTPAEREQFANDPLNLLAVDGRQNEAKGDSDAASWLPPDRGYWCRYAARQLAVKTRYRLWVTQAEYDAIAGVLTTCPAEPLPIPETTHG